jgi:hypothetical protein
VDGEGGIGYRNGNEEFFGRITKLATTERAGWVFQGYLAAATEYANSIQFALIGSHPNRFSFRHAAELLLDHQPRLLF